MTALTPREVCSEKKKKVKHQCNVGTLWKQKRQTVESWIYTHELHNVGTAVVIVGKVNVTT